MNVLSSSQHNDLAHSSASSSDSINLLRAAHELAAAPDKPSVLEYLLRVCGSLVRAQRGALLTPNPDGWTVDVLYDARGHTTTCALHPDAIGMLAATLDEASVDYTAGVVLQSTGQENLFLRLVVEKRLEALLLLEGNTEITITDLQALEMLVALAARALERIGELQAIREDRRVVEDTLQRQIAFSRLITHISTRSMSLTPEQIDTVMQEEIRRVAEFIGADLAGIALYSADGSIIDLMYGWDPAHTSTDPLRNISTDPFSWTASKYRRHEMIVVPDVAKMPPEAAAEQAFLRGQGVETFVGLPMFVGNDLLGVVVLSKKQRDEQWPGTMIALLSTAAEVFAHTIVRTRTDMVLRKTQARLQAIVDNATAGIALLDEAGKFLEVNDFWLAMLGYSAEECRTISIHDLLSTDGSDGDSRAWQSLFQQSTTPWRIELRLRTKAGHLLWADLSATPIHDMAGPPSSVLVIVVDITERKRQMERLRLMESAVVNTNDAVVISVPSQQHRALTILYVNKAFEHITGYSAEEIVGKSPRFLHGPKTDSATVERIRGCMVRGERSHAELVHYRKDGSDVWLELDVAPAISEQGDITHWITILRDITDRRRAQDALLRARDELEQRVLERTTELIDANSALQVEIRERQISEERYRTLVETSPSAILVTDLKGRIQLCNQRAAALFGYERVEDMYGINGSELVDSSAAHSTHVRMILEPEHSRDIEYVLCRRDGSRFHAEVSSSVVMSPDGRPTSLVIVVHDISTRKAAEKALTTAYHHVAALNRHLSHSRNLLQALFDGLEDGLLLLDETGHVQVVNRTLAQLLGTTPEAMLHEAWTDVYQRVAPSFPGHVALSARDAGQHQFQRTRYTSPDGATRILDIRVIALGDSESASFQVIMHVIDTTETIRLQEQVIASEHFAASGRLAASVAHEINTPLQTIQTNLKLLHVNATSENQVFLGDALEEIRRVGRIVRQLLDFYRPAAMVNGPVDVVALIERILLLLGKRIRDQRVSIVWDRAPDLLPVYGRADELTQVMLNLVVNALDVMPHGGVLGIQVLLMEGAAADVSRMRVAISDTGPGIPPTLSDTIFEPFVTTKANGTGLGLSISRQIVNRHGGTITGASNAGQGSTFAVELPINRPPHLASFGGEANG